VLFTDPVAKIAGAPPVLRGEGQSVLYVDDEESLVYLVTRVLERLGYYVTGFTDAGQALARFRANPDAYQVVVTDLAMPGMSGVEFAEQVLKVRPQLPVVMTSGYVRPKDRERVLRTGVRDLLLKPNTVEELGDVLHRLMRENRSRAE
jgi:CheY-like chemotaxis protein